MELLGTNAGKFDCSFPKPGIDEVTNLLYDNRTTVLFLRSFVFTTIVAVYQSKVFTKSVACLQPHELHTSLMY